MPEISKIATIPEKGESPTPQNELSYINLEFLERALKAKVRSFKTYEGSNPGDNFTSVLYSLDVILEGQSQPLPLLLKVYPSHPVRQKFLDATNFFWKELLVYKTLIPEYEKMQIEKKSELILRPAVPKFYDGKAIFHDMNYPELSSKDSDYLANYILMLDARKSSGFKMANKLEGLDFEHCSLVMSELAKLHALGLAYKEHHRLPSLSSKFLFLKETFFVKGNPVIEPVFKGGFETVLNVLENDPEIKQNSAALSSIRKLEAIALMLMETFTASEGVDEKWARDLRRIKNGDNSGPINGQWIVGSHGDTWINNILYRYDPKTNKPLETMLVDLQIFRECCLTVDLVYFFYTSTESKIRRERLDELLKIYHDSFLSCCNTLGTMPFKDFSLKALKAKFHRSKILGFVISVLILPIILTSPENATNMEELEVTGENKGDLSGILESIKIKEGSKDHVLMRNRFREMVQELYEDGVL